MDVWGGQDIFAGLSESQIMLLVVVQIWDLIWKGFALWRAARRRDTLWFVLLILINSAGLLPVFYLFYISPDRKKKVLKVKAPGILKEKLKKEDSQEKTKSDKKKK